MKEMETIISNNIEKLMHEHNLNNRQMAKIAGVSESTVGKWLLKKSSPRMGAIQKMADHFGLPKSYILEEDIKRTIVKTSDYNYYPISISAGAPFNVRGTSAEQINIPDAIMGKWSGQSDINVMRINGQSMNEIIPDQSLIAVKSISIHNLKDNDIVVFSDDNDYSVKRFYDDTENERFVFSPESTDKRFIDYTVPYERAGNLKIHGKVVVYIVELD